MKDPFFMTHDNKLPSHKMAHEAREERKYSGKMNKKPKRDDLEDDIDDVMELDHYSDKEAEEDAEEDNSIEESAAEKRIRLAKQYIKSLENEDIAHMGFDAEEIERSYINERLKKDAVSGMRDKVVIYSYSLCYF
jgi:ribosomal RNA-processing protein 9